MNKCLPKHKCIRTLSEPTAGCKGLPPSAHASCIPLCPAKQQSQSLRASESPSFSFTRALLQFSRSREQGCHQEHKQVLLISLCHPWQEQHSRQQRGWRTDSPGTSGMKPGCYHLLTQGYLLSVRTAHEHLWKDVGLGTTPCLHQGLGKNGDWCCPSDSLLQ